MRSATTFSLAALVAATALVARPVVAGDDDPKLTFERYTLPSGMEVILHQDNSVPLVAVDVWYHVGSGNERVGRSGFAHLFEHMLFQGSEHVGEDRHFEILKNIGATSVNGSTNTDRTNYFEVVPSHQLETALWLESDRMGYLLPLLTQKSLDNQIEVVRNERRQRIDNVPYGPSYMTMIELLYPEGHPYKYGVIGRHEDLAAADLSDVKRFYRRWYAPANATLVVAGDFERDAAKKLIDKWFGSFPASEKPSLKAPPVPTVERVRKEVSDDFAKLRQITYAWHSPASYTAGDAELSIVAHALGADGTGRLYKRLVIEQKLAQSVRVYQDDQQFSGIFVVQVRVRTGADLEQVEKTIEMELSKIKATPISERELARAVTRVESRFVWGLESLLARAETLQTYNHYLDTPDYITQDLDRYRNATPEKVRAVAERYLTDDRVEILTVPADGGAK